METKTCRKCKKDIPLDGFYEFAGRVQTTCKKCKNKSCMEYRHRMGITKFVEPSYKKLLNSESPLDKKKCSRCKESKLVTDFYLHNGRRPPECKECKMKLCSAYRELKRKTTPKVSVFRKKEAPEPKVRQYPVRHQPINGRKVCKTCNEDKSVDDFYTFKGKMQATCKICKNKSSREYRISAGITKLREPAYKTLMSKESPGDSKICSKCKVAQPVTNFYIYCNSRRSACGTCSNMYYTAYRAEKEKADQEEKDYERKLHNIRDKITTTPRGVIHRLL